MSQKDGNDRLDNDRLTEKMSLNEISSNGTDIIMLITAAVSNQSSQQVLNKLMNQPIH